MAVALITGCNGQIGQGFVSTLLNLDYKVYGIDLGDNPVNEKVNYFKGDITKSSDIKKIVDSISEGIDVLVNNAGVSCFSPFEERTEEELDFVINVNLKATILLTQAVYNHSMKNNNKGKVVNLGSIYGQVAGDMRLYKEGDRRTPEIYGATKAAVINVTKYFAAYMAPHNVQVNSISPGGVFNHQDPEFVEKYENKVPMSRMGSVDDLQKTLEYLIDPKNNYLTGQNITVDGGFTAW